jgi:hypothetical protein
VDVLQQQRLHQPKANEPPAGPSRRATPLVRAAAVS